MYSLPLMLPERSRRRAQQQLDVDPASRPFEAPGNPEGARRTLDRIAFRYKPGKQPTDLTHAEAKEVLFAFGLSQALYDAALRGNVIDAMQNTLAKQAVALPSRFVRFGAVGAFDAMSPPRDLADFGGDGAAWRQHADARAAQSRALIYAGQHARGTAHFVLNALATPLDASSHARSLPPNAFTKDGTIASLIQERLREGMSRLEALLPAGLPTHDLQRIQSHLARCVAALQPEVDRFVDAQTMAPPGSARNVESVMRGITELVDTSGKIIIANLMDAAVPGLSRTGLQQLWSLVSYPLMEAVIKTMQNWRDTLTIARIAMSQYLQAKDHMARVSDDRLQDIARYVQSHFEPASVANYGRRMTHLLAPQLQEMRTRLAGHELDLARAEEKSNARSLPEFERISRRIRLQDKTLVDEGRIRISAASYSASMEVVEVLTHELQACPQLQPGELDALLDAQVDCLLEVHVAPTPAAKAAFAKLAKALEALGIEDGEAHLVGRFQSMLANRRDVLRMVMGEDFYEPLSPEQPVSSTYTEIGRAKLQARKRLDEQARNLRIRRDIIRRDAEVAALQQQIERLARHPPHDGFNAQLELAEKQRWSTRAITRERRAIDPLKLRIERYAADVEHYRRKDFDRIERGGEVWQALMSGSTGAGAAVRRAWQYGLMRTLKNRRSLGLAMAVAYDPSLSRVGARGVFEDPLANGLAEGFLTAGTPMAALTIPIGARYIKAQPPALSHVSRGLAADAEGEPGPASLASAIEPLQTDPKRSGAAGKQG